MAIDVPAPGGGSEPIYVRQQRTWGGNVARAINGLTEFGRTRLPGGQLPRPRPSEVNEDAFVGQFDHLRRTSTTYALTVKGGRAENAKGAGTVAAAQIALPVSGDLYVYVAVTLTNANTAPSGAIASNATRPAYWSSPNVANVVLGVLSEIETGVWQWFEEHRGNILFDEANETTSVKNATYIGEHQETARAGVSWNRYSQGANRGFKHTVSTGAAYFDAGDNIFYGFVQDNEYDSIGHLISSSDERRVAIFTPCDLADALLVCPGFIAAICDGCGTTTTTVAPEPTTTTTTPGA